MKRRVLSVIGAVAATAFETSVTTVLQWASDAAIIGPGSRLGFSVLALMHPNPRLERP
jgi:hypothetical protein